MQLLKLFGEMAWQPLLGDLLKDLHETTQFQTTGHVQNPALIIPYI